MSKENGYVGKIKNRSTQSVKAPYGGSEPTKGNIKITGNDLRIGKKKGGK